MCLDTPTHEDSHSLYCEAQKDNGRFNTRPASCDFLMKWKEKNVYKNLKQ